jgi:hypothetical protein
MTYRSIAGKRSGSRRGVRVIHTRCRMVGKGSVMARQQSQSRTCSNWKDANWGRQNATDGPPFNTNCVTYLNCDDGADAMEASAARPGNEKEVEV